MSTPKESVLSMEAAQQLADANDIAECQKTARKMRVAGVAMPPPLIALAALDIRYQQNSGAAQNPLGLAARRRTIRCRNCAQTNSPLAPVAAASSGNGKRRNPQWG